MIELRKAVRRKTEIPRHGRYTVELAPEGIRYREYGRRTWLLLPHGHAIVRAAELEAGRRRRDRELARKERRAARRRS